MPLDTTYVENKAFEPYKLIGTPDRNAADAAGLHVCIVEIVAARLYVH